MEGDDAQRKGGEHDVDFAPGADDGARLLLLAQGAHKAGAVRERRVGAVKIDLLAGGERGLGGSETAGTVERLQAVLFERLGFSRAQSLDRVFQFQDAFLQGLDDTDAVAAGLAGNGVRLPDIEQTTGDAADDQDEQGHQCACAKALFAETTQILAVIVQDVREVRVQQRDHDGDDANPGVHPEPVLRLARQAAHEAAAQRVSGGESTSAKEMMPKRRSGSKNGPGNCCDLMAFRYTT